MRWALKKARGRGGQQLGDGAVAAPARAGPTRRGRLRSTLASATSHPSPSVAACSSSIPKPSHSSRTERSVGSWSSTIRMPVADRVGHAGGDEDRVARADRQGVAARRAGRRGPASSTQRAQRVRARRPRASRPPPRAPARAARTIHASVLPKSSPRCSCANGRSGWWWTGRRSPASSSLTRSAGLAPKRAACAAPSHHSGSAASASRTKPPSGIRLSPRSLSPKSVDAEPIHSSGEWSPPTSIPRSSAIAGPPR